MGPSGLCRTILAYTGLSTYIGHMLDTRPCAAIYVIDIPGVPKGIRTPVTAVKGRCPRPLDDGDATAARTRDLERQTRNCNRPALSQHHDLLLGVTSAGHDAFELRARRRVLAYGQRVVTGTMRCGLGAWART